MPKINSANIKAVSPLLLCIKNGKCAGSYLYFWPNKKQVVDHVICFCCGEIKKALGTKSVQNDDWLISMFWLAKNSFVWADMWELVLSWGRMLHLFFNFFRFLQTSVLSSLAQQSFLTPQNSKANVNHCLMSQTSFL